MCSIPNCALLALLATLSACQSTTGKTVSQTMKDASITTAVQTKLMSDRLSNMSRVNVDTERGVVTLSGLVATEGQRVRAERLAHQVTGVVRVNNNLQIQHRLPNIIQGDELRVEYDNLIIRRSDGHEVRLQYDENTQMTGHLGPREHIEAKVKVNEQRHALSVRQLQ